MDYFCYISQNKVDQLCANFEDGEVVEWVQQAGKTSEKKGSAGLSGLFSILGTDISYGRSDMFQKNETVKRTYVQKLKTCIRHFAKDIEAFSWDKTRDLPGRFFFLKDTFHLKNLDEKSLIVSIAVRHQNQSLVLDCSLKYFSDEPVRDGKPNITSTNSRFFSCSMSLQFETVFLLLSRDGETFYGSPIYLKIAPVPGLVI